MMDDTSSSSSQISSLLLGHLFSSSSSSSTSTSFAGVSHHHIARQMPFTAYATPDPHAPSLFVPCSGGGGGAADEKAEGGGDIAVVPLGFDPAEFLHGGGRRRRRTTTTTPAELDFDPYDGGESEEGVEASEEPAKPVPGPGSGGSKRSRAAEVHNLYEKRRRNRINEKMKELQNLIPNSNKTDKASMLDDAIGYLKQLQLQVQMLSMRNIDNMHLHPMYLPGELQALQASQMRFGMDYGSLMNIGVGTMPVNQNSSAQNSFGIEASRSHHGSFHLSVPAEEMYAEDMVPQRQLDTGHTTKNLPEAMNASTSPHFDGQTSLLEGTEQLVECILIRGRSEEVFSKDQDNQILIQHLQGLQTGRSFSSDDVKTETQEF